MSILPLIKGTVVVKLKVTNEPVSAIIQLIKANKADSTGKGELGNKTSLKSVFDNNRVSGDNEYTFHIFFEYDENFGIPGAFFIRNLLTTEFLLVSLTLEDIPNLGNIHFDCNSWIYNQNKYQSDRIFFTNQTYLPSETPAPLVFYRQFELQTLRGDGTGERNEWERIYDYDFYNDLGDPDKDPALARPVAGGSSDVPYPRRCRTGRKPTNTDPKSESRSSYVYIPRDEVAVNLNFKTKTSVVEKLESMAEDAVLKLKPASNKNSSIEDEFHTFDDVFELFETGQYPLPQVIQVNKTGWITDEEFAREIIAGVNPGLIRSIKDLPPKIKLHYEFEATQSNRLFLLDHYDTVMPNLRRINSTTTSRIYASKTYLFLTNDETLKPLAIELSLPNPEGDEFDVVSEVYFPATEGTVEGSIWQLAKAYVVVNDECVHQIISHWLHTHAVTEPFIIAANRQLSVVHPIYKLLRPHFRNTMNINAAARKILLNADGVVETIYAWRKYGVEMSSTLYKNWVFPEQALPTDLIKRGMAVEDPTSPRGIKLLIEDYPYADDGLDIWCAIKTWVQEYVYLYYTSDELIQQDSELQAWWKEVVEVGHGDKKDEKWWPKMQNREELIQSCVTIIWIGSVLHASVNFSQYPYGGLILNRPTLSRRFMPKEGTAEYEELVNNPEQAYLNTITSKPVTKVDLNMLELLSTHASDEYYLGQRESALSWTSDLRAIEAFQKFGATIAEIGDKINEKNEDKSLKNRYGPVLLPYTLLYPTSEEGITFKGVPNSISI